MNIYGFLPISFSDYPMKISSVIFTYGCNFRCPWCHNKHLWEEKQMIRVSEKTVLGILISRKSFISSVVISGGEPTIQEDLSEFIKKLKDLGFFVKLDTNGTNPRFIEDNIDILDIVAIDIKSPPNKYSKFTGTAVSRDSVLENFSIIESVWKKFPGKFIFRTTLVPGLTEEDLLEIKELSPSKNVILQPHKEHKDA